MTRGNWGQIFFFHYNVAIFGFIIVVRAIVSLWDHSLTCLLTNMRGHAYGIYKNLRRYLDTMPKEGMGMERDVVSIIRCSRALNVRLPNLPPPFRRQIFTHTNSYPKNEQGGCSFLQDHNFRPTSYTHSNSILDFACRNRSNAPLLPSPCSIAGASRSGGTHKPKLKRSGCAQPT